MRSKQDIEQTMQAYGDTVWRVCTLHFPGHFDAQDAFQNTFLKYAQADTMAFADEEHKKAWLIRVATEAIKFYLDSPRCSANLYLRK